MGRFRLLRADAVRVHTVYRLVSGGSTPILAIRAEAEGPAFALVA